MCRASQKYLYPLNHKSVCILLVLSVTQQQKEERKILHDFLLFFFFTNKDVQSVADSVVCQSTLLCVTGASLFRCVSTNWAHLEMKCVASSSVQNSSSSVKLGSEQEFFLLNKQWKKKVKIIPTLWTVLGSFKHPLSEFIVRTIHQNLKKFITINDTINAHF